METHSDPRSGINEFISLHKTLILVLAIGFILRLAFFIAIRPWQENFITNKIIMVDAEPYNTFAENILRSGSFAQTGTYRTPGYPVFLALVYLTFGNKPWIAIFIQIFIGVLTVFLVYLWANEWFGRRVASISAFLYAVEPHVIIYGACLLTETLFVFSILLSVYLWLYGTKRSKAAYVALGAVILGYAALIKPIALLLPAVLIFVSVFMKEVGFKFRLRSALTLVVVFLMVISTWMFKNYRQYGHFSLTHINGFNLLYVSAAYTNVAITGKSYAEVCKEFDAAAKEKGAFDTADLFKQSEIFRSLGVAYIREHMRPYMVRHLTGMVTLFTNLASTDTMDLVGLNRMQRSYNVYEFNNFAKMVSWYFRNKTTHEIIFGIFVSAFLLLSYALCFMGMWAAYKEKLYLSLLINIPIAFYFCFMTGVFGVARYRLPLIPFYMLFTAKGLLSSLSLINAGKSRPNVTEG